MCVVSFMLTQSYERAGPVTAKETEHRNGNEEFCMDGLGSELIASESKFTFITRDLG